MQKNIAKNCIGTEDLIPSFHSFFYRKICTGLFSHAWEGDLAMLDPKVQPRNTLARHMSAFEIQISLQAFVCWTDDTDDDDDDDDGFGCFHVSAGLL